MQRLVKEPPKTPQDGDGKPSEAMQRLFGKQAGRGGEEVWPGCKWFHG